MSTATAPAISLTAGEVLAQVRAERERELGAAANQLGLAVVWAKLHPAETVEDCAGWGTPSLHGEGVCPLAGPGAPLVAEFAPAALAAELGIRLDAGMELLSEGLELAYRLPRLWDLVQCRAVPAWRARRIARLTTDLPMEAASYADRLICADPARIHRVNAERLVDEVRLRFDPDRAADDEETALKKRGVWLRHGRSPATTDVTMTLDTRDADRFDDTVRSLAGQLRRLGDTDGLDQRRAAAVGILADPQQALDLLDGDGSATEAGRSRTGSIELFVHLDADQVPHREAPTGFGDIERLGAATTELLKAWLVDATRVNVRPVIDLTSRESVDRHDPPSWMRDAVVLRDATCVFPGCTRDSRHCDQDHVDAYVDPADGGPPGQTCLDNLAPLCRTHHRMKTHGRWAYRRTAAGSYEWTSPDGRRFSVITGGRRPSTPR